MTAATTGTELLLEATDIAKTYGSVVALRSASLGVRRGEVHALMGANGAGKSTLVKILTGAVRPDHGRILVRGRELVARSPGDARRHGIVSVYQEPALIPDLDIYANLRLTQTPVDAFRHWIGQLGLTRLDLADQARQLPLASQRVIDLARALAIEPDVLMLDEMTAALPANLTERVLEVIGGLRGGERSVLFISHRMIEISAVCDRATVLREGETVGVVDVTAGSEERIVQLMLGEIAEQPPATDAASAQAALKRHEGMQPRLAVRGVASGTRLQEVTFDVYQGEVVGVIALEGQGQDELFDILSGSSRASGGEVLVDGKAVSFRHPADAIRAGVVYVAADRAEALLMQRNVRENITLPTSAGLPRWGWINLGSERKKVSDAVETLQIDARAGAEVRRLSGGNQQKVTIARWVAGGVTTMLCFDPTRGIDIRTKNQIYRLLRDLAEAGAAILMYTSELKEIQLACDRVVVIFGGRVVATMPAANADEPTLLRAAYNLKSDAPMPEEVAAEVVAGETASSEVVADGSEERDPAMTAAAPPAEQPASSPFAALGEAVRRDAWLVGLVVLLGLLLFFTKTIQPTYGPAGIQGLALSVLPLALAAIAQTVAIISGGIDLSIGAMMALTNCVAAVLMQNKSEEFGLAVAVSGARAGHRDRRHQWRAHRRYERGRHHRHTGHVLRLGGFCAARDRRTRWLAIRLAPVSIVSGPLLNEWVPKSFIVLAIVVAPFGCPFDGRGLASRSMRSVATHSRRSGAGCRSAERRSSPTR